MLAHMHSKPNGKRAWLTRGVASVVLCAFLSCVVVPDFAWSKSFKPGYPDVGQAFDEIEDDGRQRLLVGTLITLGVIGIVMLSIALAKKARRRADQARGTSQASSLTDMQDIPLTLAGEVTVFKW
jgi:hypothetical protein